MKRIIQHDQLGFLTRNVNAMIVQNMQINKLKHHINKRKDKNNMIILIKSENAYGRI